VPGQMWPIGLIMAIFVAFILLLAPDPYIAFGVAFILLMLAPIFLFLFLRRRHHPMPMPATGREG